MSDDFVRQCEFPARFYYNLFLLTGQSEKISSISLGSGGSFSWTLTRNEGEFLFTFPAPLSGKPASSGELDLLIHSLLESPAKGLVPVGIHKAGKTVLNVEVAFSDKRVEKVVIFEVEGEDNFYLANSTIQNGNFIITKEHLEQLDKKAFQMRQRSVLSVETGKIGSMRVLQGNQTFVGMKSDKTWINFVDKKPLLGIDMSLWRLNELKFEAEPVVNLSETSEKVMELELMNGEGVRMIDVAFFSDPELPAGQCWLSHGNSSVYFPVSNKLLEDLQGQIPLRK